MQQGNTNHGCDGHFPTFEGKNLEIQNAFQHDKTATAADNNK